MIHRPPISPLFPYTTLFRSRRSAVPRSPWAQSLWRSDSRAERICRPGPCQQIRSEEHTSELQSLRHLVCRLLLEKKKNIAAVVERIYLSKPTDSVTDDIVLV